MLAERGIDVSYESVRRWALKFGSAYAHRLRRLRPRPDCRWHLDEVFVSINGKRMYLWHAVDNEGEVLDILVQRRRDKRAALKLMRKLLKKQGFVPDASSPTNWDRRSESDLPKLQRRETAYVVRLFLGIEQWRRHWLWRAVDNDGKVLDSLVQSKRNAKTALKLIRKVLKKQGWAPNRITTDKLSSYYATFRTLGLTAEHIDDKRANNRAENSHEPVRRRERKQQRLKSSGSAQRFLNVWERASAAT
jgi:transposase-like protein